MHIQNACAHTKKNLVWVLTDGKAVNRQLDVVENRSSKVCQDYLIPDWKAALLRDTALSAPMIQCPLAAGM